MVHYAKDEYSLLIDFEDNYQITKRKAKLFKKITKDIEIYIVLYDRFVDEIKCCNQDLYWLDEIAENINVYFCEACQNHYLIHDEIIDSYISMNMKFEILRKIRFFKGEFKNGK
jgi:hypothetical protein